jgi:hypothetical protein
MKANDGNLMPKTCPAIPDDTILALFSDRAKLSDDLWITPKQLSMLLGRSVDQLCEDRKVGNPPAFMKPQGGVRYRLGTVRDFMLGFASEEYKNTRQAKIGLRNRALLSSSGRPTRIR